MSGSVIILRSGLSRSCLPASSTPIVASRASGERPSLSACGLEIPSESHILGVGAMKIVPSFLSVASRLPALSDSSVRPVADSGKASSVSFAAASLFLTTRTCEKPSTSAVTWRSTPGMTSA